MRHPRMQIVAWNGVVSMHKADWGDEAGSTVTFKLSMKGNEGSRNPFESFTKRRKGRAGTRFFMAVTTAETEPQALYKDEVMLAGWNDSQSTGHTVKFWLCNDRMGHPFEGISRKQELALALSELDDDNEPIDQKMRDRVEKGGKRPSERLSYVAAMLCKQEAFHDWCTERAQVDDVSLNPPVDNEQSARGFILQECGISSRAELDQPGQQVQIFHDQIRKPYLDWYSHNFGQDAPF